MIETDLKIVNQRI